MALTNRSLEYDNNVSFERFVTQARRYEWNNMPMLKDIDFRLA